jgi:hypothetical protein
MAITLYDMIKLVTPPIFVQLAKHLRGYPPPDNYDLSGDYHSWDEAVTASSGGICAGFSLVWRDPVCMAAVGWLDVVGSTIWRKT